MKYLIVGLGNIGAEYENTRHNIGFIIADKIAGDEVFKSEKLGALSMIKYKGRQIYILKPNTYMNLSGKAIRYWLTKLKIPVENLMAVTDDVNLEFGKIRIRKKGSSGGHNGLQNIQDMLNTNIYPRLRFGIGNDYAQGQQIDYVLGNFSPEQVATMDEYTEKCKNAVLAFTTTGLERAMNGFNG